MHVEAALGAVEDGVLKLTFEVGLHHQELEPQHLRVNRDRMIASTGSLASSTISSALTACLAKAWTARSRTSRSRRCSEKCRGS